MRSRVHALTCAACGGTLTCDDHEPSVTCPYCETDNYLMGEDLPRSFYVEPVLEAAGAVKVARKETSDETVDPGFSRELRIERKDLVFLPFNAVRAIRTGRMVVMQEKRPRGERIGSRHSFHVSISSGIERAFERPWSELAAGTRMAEPPESDTKILFSEFVMHEPACDAIELGADHVRLEKNVFGKEGRPLVPYNRDTIASTGTVLEPERHPRELRVKLQDAGRDEPGGRRIDVVGAQLFQIYYPVWVIRGTFAGRSHRFVVDAVDGNLLTGRVPSSGRHRALVSTAALLMAAAPVTLAARGAVWWASPGGGGGLEAGGLTMLCVVAAALLVAMGWGLVVMGWLTGTLLRSRELVFKGGLLTEEIVDLPAVGPLERFGTRLLDGAERILKIGAGASRYE